MSSLWPIFVALIPLLIAVAGGLWGLYQWLDSQKTAEVSRSIEARQPFLKLQLERYQEAAHTVGQLATTNVANFDKDRWDKLEIRFWELFYTELSMVEDDQVKTALENFAGSLTRFKEAWFTPFDPQADRPNQDQLGILRHGQKDMKDRAYQLAKALQASIITGWAVPLKE